MGEIKHFSKVDFSDLRSIQQLVTAAKADPGFWLKERMIESRMLAVSALNVKKSEGAAPRGSHRAKLINEVRRCNPIDAVSIALEAAGTVLLDRLYTEIGPGMRLTMTGNPSIRLKAR